MKKELLLSSLLLSGIFTVSADYKKGDIIDFTPTLQGEVLSVNGTTVKTDIYANPDNKPTGALDIPYSYSLPSGDVAVPIQIAADGFKQCQITSVNIGAGVEYIGKNAFYGCTQLTSTSNSSGSVKSIGEYAFYRTYDLNTATFPGCQIVNEWAFNYSGVTTADFTEVEYIYGGGFYQCQNLTTFKGGENLKMIDNIAFANCPKLKAVMIGPNVTSIGTTAFAYCESLKDIVIPEGCTSVGKDAFSGIALNRVFILSPVFMNYCDETLLLRDKAIQTVYCPESMISEIKNYIATGSEKNDPQFLASQASILPLSDLVEMKQLTGDTFQLDIKYGDISAIRVFNPDTNSDYTQGRGYVYDISADKAGLQYRVDWNNLLRYTISLDRSSAVDELTILKSGETRYYNLQGVEIAKPESGIFIMVKDGKSQKIAF